MVRSLTEDIARGRRAIALARERGLDTAAWEKQLAVLERQQLLAWAAELAERDLVLPVQVQFVEAPLRTVTTSRVSEYAARYLRTVSLARMHEETGYWGRFTAAWWEQQKVEALGALAALREKLALLSLHGAVSLPQS